MIGFVVQYIDDSGKLVNGEFVHRTPYCAIASIPFIEGRRVFGVAITFSGGDPGIEDLLRSLALLQRITTKEGVTGMQFRIDNAHLITPNALVSAAKALGVYDPEKDGVLSQSVDSAAPAADGEVANSEEEPSTSPETEVELRRRGVGFENPHRFVMLKPFIIMRKQYPQAAVKDPEQELIVSPRLMLLHGSLHDDHVQAAVRDWAMDYYGRWPGLRNNLLTYFGDEISCRWIAHVYGELDTPYRAADVTDVVRSVLNEKKAVFLDASRKYTVEYELIDGNGMSVYELLTFEMERTGSELPSRDSVAAKALLEVEAWLGAHAVPLRSIEAASFEELRNANWSIRVDRPSGETTDRYGFTPLEQDRLKEIFRKLSRDDFDEWIVETEGRAIDRNRDTAARLHDALEVIATFTEAHAGSPEGNSQSTDKKNSVGRTQLNITLDPQDPDPSTTVEFMMHEYVKTRQGAHPSSASDWIFGASWESFEVLQRGVPATEEVPPFKVGDIVCLNSGGPQMTVGRIDDAGVHCSWFPKDASFTSEATFAAKMLTNESNKVCSP